MVTCRLIKARRCFQSRTWRAVLITSTILLALGALRSKDKPKPINVRQDIVMSQNFYNPSVRLSYTVSITNQVNHIRAQNVVFERYGLIPKSERLEFCIEHHHFHICTDNNYPVIWNKDGSIEVQEASSNTDRWLTPEPQAKPPAETDTEEFCNTHDFECYFIGI